MTTRIWTAAFSFHVSIYQGSILGLPDFDPQPLSLGLWGVIGLRSLTLEGSKLLLARRDLAATLSFGSMDSFSQAMGGSFSNPARKPAGNREHEIPFCFLNQRFSLTQRVPWHHPKG